MLDFDDVVELVGRRTDLRLVAIDGLPVSGKSTLAGRLAAELGASTLFLDDFVRPEAEWRGRAEPGFPFPYMRYDAFMAAVSALARGEVAEYHAYDWATGSLARQPTTTDPDWLTLIEGVSTLHPQLAPLYDLRLWVESDAATTLTASLDRGVGDWEAEWRALFMPSVAIYLVTQPQQRADLQVRGRGVSGN